MHRRIAFGILMALLLLAVGPAPEQAAASPSKLARYSAGAFNEHFDGCIRTDVFLGALRDSSQFPPAPATVSAVLDLELEQFNTCTETWLVIGVGHAELTDLTFTGDLKGARLQTPVSVFDNVSGTTFEVLVDLTWTGVGTTTVDPSTAHFGGGVNCHTLSKSRPAIVTGTVTQGSINYTPGAWAESTIESSQEGCTS